jgi:hypothetical protein
MATVSNFALRIPPSLMEDVKALATQDAVSVNQFLVQAAAEKVAVLKARRTLSERAARANPDDLVQRFRGSTPITPPRRFCRSSGG